MVKKLLLTFSFFGCFCFTSRASVILDQSYGVSDFGYNISVCAAQHFQSGTTSTIARIDVLITATSTEIVNLNLYAGKPDAPGAFLASTSGIANPGTNYVPFDFAGCGPFLTAGFTYFFEVSGPVEWRVSTSGTYALGYFWNSCSPPIPVTNYDGNFATYMNTGTCNSDTPGADQSGINPLEISAPLGLITAGDEGFWSNDGGGVMSDFEDENSTYTPTCDDQGNTITMTWTNCCDLTTVTQTIEVPAMVAVSFSDISGICTNDGDYTLVGGSPSGGIYIGTAVSSGDFDPLAAGPGLHNIWYDYTDPYGCNAMDNHVIEVFAPLPVSAGADISQCEGTTVTLNGSGVSSYAWDGGVTDGVPFTPPFGSTVYTVTGTDLNGCQTTDNASVTYYMNPSVSLSSFSDVCNFDAPFPLSGGSPSSGTYSGIGVSGGSFLPVVAGTGVHTVTYTYTDVNGCTDFATQPITVNANPLVTLDPLPDQCVNDGLFALTGGLPLGGVWTGSGVSGTDFDPSTAAVGSHIISYTYTESSTGCAGGDSETIVVNDTTPVYLAPIDTLCAQTVPVSLVSGTPAGGVFSGPAVSGSLITPSVAGPGDHEIVYSYTNGFGCMNSDTQMVHIQPLPIVTLSDLPDQCVGGPNYTLVEGSPAGGTYSGVLVSSGIFQTSLAPPVTITITYGYFDPTTGCYNSDSKDITVNDTPSVSVSAVSNFCDGDPSYTLIEGLPTGGTYSGAGIVGGSFDPSLAGDGTHTINYSYSIGACSSDVDFDIIVNPLPNLIVSSDTLLCQGGTANLSAAGANSYNWIPSTYLSDPTGPITDCNPLVTTSYTVEGTSLDGCAATEGVVVQVDDDGGITFPDDQKACGGANVDLIVQGGIDYNWNGPSISDYHEPFLSLVADSSAWFFIEAISAAGCLYLDSVFVEVIYGGGCGLELYSAFSPNNDFVNDVFEIDNILAYPDNRVVFYNRWGDVVNSYEGYDNSAVVWDGTDRSDRLLPAGTYFFSIELGGRPHTSGWVQMTY